MTNATPITAGTLLLLAIGALSAIQPALAQRGNEVTVEVSDCLKLEAPAERLACFERRVEDVRAESPATSAPPPAAPPPPPAPPAPPVQERPARQPAPAAPSADEDSFGRPAPEPSRREQRAAAREAEAQREVREIVATIVALRETVPNYRTITLDNGQIWRQNRSEYYPLRPGLEVRLYPGRMGNSFRLTAPVLRGDIQVERVR